MTTTTTAPTPRDTTPHGKTPTDPMRKIALIAGSLYLVTFVTSIPALALKGPVLDHTDFVLGVGSQTSVLVACFLEVLLALAAIGTAVALYPVTRRTSRTAGIGFVTSRTLEASMILVGAVALLSVVTLRQNAVGTDPGLVTTASSLVAIHNWTFLLGPSVMSAVNALFLGSVMYRSRLVPRAIPTIGLIGAPILLATCTAVLFGLFDQVSGWSLLGALMVAVWELSLGLWLVIKGFSRTAVVGSTGGGQEPLVVAA
jgi:hypothetical protein